MTPRIRRSEPAPGVALLTIDRPEKLNAMDEQFFAELTAVMRALGQDDGVRAAVLTGEGRAFSAGGDVATFLELDGDVARVRPHLRRVVDAFTAVEHCAVPVVAAVNGLAFGGGTELVLACDVVLAAESARFALKEPTMGLMPTYGIVRGPQVLGRNATRLLAFTGREIDAARAERLGLVQEVHPDGELLAAAVALAAEMAAHSPLAVQVAKAFLNRDSRAGVAESTEATALLFASEEHRAAARAFGARRAL
ncbi:enoyl-CoA hydratase/isomerase family protein [Trujillonella endophytica]|uniref:Enoyl-CoA hydratase n=1 Tax=Trujillonella endophytica TaxID=673521 RepID=A0A1H8QJA6_9ACTN|nr:enoyl-CoA hydratase/isomerase family protein [Trujillella endophytica]SEO53997.1 enoyl-CoA hydratase [Trujillella endophytica]